MLARLWMNPPKLFFTPAQNFEVSTTPPSKRRFKIRRSVDQGEMRELGSCEAGAQLLRECSMIEMGKLAPGLHPIHILEPGYADLRPQANGLFVKSRDL